MPVGKNDTLPRHSYTTTFFTHSGEKRAWLEMLAKRDRGQERKDRESEG